MMQSRPSWRLRGEILLLGLLSWSAELPRASKKVPCNKAKRLLWELRTCWRAHLSVPCICGEAVSISCWRQREMPADDLYAHLVPQDSMSQAAAPCNPSCSRLGVS